MRTRIVLASVATALVAAVGVAFTASAGESPSPAATTTPAATHRFSRESIDLFAELPVQDGGRVKPLSTYAQFALLALNGKRTVKTPTGDKLEPTEWLMECLFFPEEASKIACFRVQDAEALDALGLAHEGKNRRDWYSFADLEPAFGKLGELAGQYERVPEKERNPVQGEIVHLDRNIVTFMRIAGLLSSFGPTIPASESPALAKTFGPDARPTLLDVLARAEQVRPLLGHDSGHDSGHAHGQDGHGHGEDGDLLQRWLDVSIANSRGLALIPPDASAPEGAEWLSPGDVVERRMFDGEPLTAQVAALRDLAAMASAREDDYAFRTSAEAFRTKVVGLAESRGEYRKVPLEVTYYRADFFSWAQIVYVLGFLLAALSWIKPAKVFTRGAAGAVVVATLCVVAGITMRCVIRGRPPVSTLYETILFITAVASIVLLVTERVNRKGIALGLATVLGSGGMFLASRYELTESVDTMPSLVAVLDTNFWLATHVTCVTIGYGAGLLAGAVGHVYVLGKVFGLKKNDAGFYKSLTTMTYGMLCFGLLFSVVGTILGGIWANESWGRFWGWDPKENGALTIVLWELIVLHARMGGYVRDFGIAMASVFGAAVVAASWWGVNLLGVGLHSYGFTSGILWSLLGYFAVEGAVLAAGGAWWMWFREEMGAASSPS